MRRISDKDLIAKNILQVSMDFFVTFFNIFVTLFSKSIFEKIVKYKNWWSLISGGQKFGWLNLFTLISM